MSDNYSEFIKLRYNYANNGGFLMIEIIAGEKGKGKTKYLLDYVNKSIGEAKGNIVFLDEDDQHMYKLDNHIRLINVSDYLITNSDEFIGFLCGIISQDHDLEGMYLDNFLSLGNISIEEITRSVHKLKMISEQFDIKIVLSISKKITDLPEIVQDNLLISL